MLISYIKDENGRERANIDTDKETADRMRELFNLFGDIPLDTMRSMFHSDAGRLAYAVLCGELDSLPVKMLIDELTNEYISAETSKQFVTRQAMLNELEDILKAKSITPYRRSRINKALKRACIKCHGSGKEVRKVDTGRDYTGHRIMRHEISSHFVDCMHCKGGGINPREEIIKIGDIEITKAELEQVENLDEIKPE